MKNFYQNLLIVLALGLCALCAFQWYGQTLQRTQIDSLNKLIYDKSTAIQGYTNSINTMEHQIARMDGQITEFKDTVRTNNQTILAQKREINKLEATDEGLNKEITDYKDAVDKFQAKLKEAYDGVKKQNDAIKELTAQRDEFVQKLNDSVKDRNDVVSKYNELVARVEKLQAAAAK
jgi:chromosome segregation ATPase